MAKIEISTVINRHLEDVFAVLSNFENNPKWQTSAIEVKKTSEGPIGVGTRYRGVFKLLGQRIESESEMTEYEPNRKVTGKSTSGPFPAEVRTNFERFEGSTRVNIAAELAPGGFFRLAEPLVVSLAKRQLEADLANLKELMEAHAL